MDRKAAEDYHKTLFLELGKKRSSIDKLLWIPAIGLAAYFSFGGLSSAFFGSLIGWGFCATFTRIEDVQRDIFRAEFLRHLHEHTDEAEDGQRRANLEDTARKLTKKWFG